MGGFTKMIGQTFPVLQPLDVMKHDYRAPEQQAATDPRKLAADQAEQSALTAQAEQDRLGALPQTSGEEYLARKRATAARQALGGASSTLTGTLG